MRALRLAWGRCEFEKGKGPRIGDGCPGIPQGLRRPLCEYDRYLVPLRLLTARYNICFLREESFNDVNIGASFYVFLHCMGNRIPPCLWDRGELPWSVDASINCRLGDVRVRFDVLMRRHAIS